MAAPSPKLSEAKWRQLFEMGDQLLLQPSIFSQVELIRQELGKITAAKVNLMLSRRFLPLPSQKADFQRENPQIFEVFPESGKEIDENSNFERERSSIGIPLIRDGKMYGNLTLEYPLPQKFSNEYRDFLAMAGKYFLNILEISRVAALKKWRQEQLSLVRTVGMEIVRIRDTYKLFDRIVDLVQTTFQFYFVGIYTPIPDGQKLILQACAGEQLSSVQVDALNLMDGIPYGQGLVGLCASSKQEILSQDVERDPRYRLVDGLEETRSEICLPLLISDQVLGVLEILSEREHAFHKNDVMVLRILADSIALAIENAGLFEDLLKKNWISTVMLQIAEAAQAYDNIQDLLAACVRILPMLVGVEKCAIFMRGKNKTDYYLNTHFGFSKQIEPKIAMLPYDELVAKRFNEVSLLKIPLDLDPDLLGDKSFDFSNKAKCCKLIPMIAHNRVFGILLVDEEPRKLDQVLEQKSIQLDVLMAVARQIALAIENFELDEFRKYEAYITAVLLQVAEMVAASENLDETLANIINLLPLVVGVDTAFIYLRDDDNQRFNLRSYNSKSWKKNYGNLPQHIKVKQNRSLHLLCQNLQPVFCPAKGLMPDSWSQIDFRPFLSANEIPMNPEPQLMVFPLHVGHESFGFLTVYESLEGFEVREKKVEIIKGIAQQLSIAIQNEHLKKEMVDQEQIRREFQLAQDIQKTFLPEKLPEIEGWDIDVRWRPALQVGGDFYDVIWINETEVGFLIADVSDKGLPAALYMTVTRTIIHTAASEGNSPLDTLFLVNKRLLENSREGLFITAFYGVLNTVSGELVYANAGHNKPLLLRANRQDAVWLEKGGMPLGVAAPLDLENKIIQMRKGDYLVMYTDGVTEARSPLDAFFSEDRLFNIIKHYDPEHDGSLVEMIDSRVLDFQSSAPASDDVTIFTLQRLRD